MLASQQGRKRQPEKRDPHREYLASLYQAGVDPDTDEVRYGLPAMAFNRPWTAVPQGFYLGEPEWRDIPSYEGLYQAHSWGLVRSLPRLGWDGRWRGGQVVEFDGRQARAPKILRQQIGTNRNAGRPQVMLCREGQVRLFNVSTLVALAFIGPRPAGQEVCHLDECKSHNWRTNLEYNTPEANRRSFLLAGRHHNSQKTCCPQCGSDFTVLASGYRRCDPCANKASRASRERRKSHG